MRGPRSLRARRSSGDRRPRTPRRSRTRLSRSLRSQRARLRERLFGEQVLLEIMACVAPGRGACALWARDDPHRKLVSQATLEVREEEVRGSHVPWLLLYPDEIGARSIGLEHVAEGRCKGVILLE